MWYTMAQVKAYAKSATQSLTGVERTIYFSWEKLQTPRRTKFPGNEANGLISRRQSKVPEGLKGKRTDLESNLPAQTTCKDITQIYLLWNGKSFGGTWVIQAAAIYQQGKYLNIC